MSMFSKPRNISKGSKGQTGFSNATSPANDNDPAQRAAQGQCAAGPERPLTATEARLAQGFPEAAAAFQWPWDKAGQPEDPEYDRVVGEISEVYDKACQDIGEIVVRYISAD